LGGFAGSDVSAYRDGGAWACAGACRRHSAWCSLHAGAKDCRDDIDFGERPASVPQLGDACPAHDRVRPRLNDRHHRAVPILLAARYTEHLRRADASRGDVDPGRARRRHEPAATDGASASTACAAFHRDRHPHSGGHCDRRRHDCTACRRRRARPGNLCRHQHEQLRSPVRGSDPGGAARVSRGLGAGPFAAGGADWAVG